MKQILLVSALAALTACAAPSMPSASREVPVVPLVETPSSPRPEKDISESQRIKWSDEQRAKSAPVYRPVQVERVVIRERTPVYREPRRTWDDWYLPLTFSLGWWGGHGRRGGHGWGWGLGWHSGWWR